ncbi:MAG: ParB/RepB/Spo0J family partition protein [Candidatus Aminicenantes bacterium]|nr:ParB/RepB/Spo0J family partition protein [Candidatus Aminicenantes bacterium]
MIYKELKIEDISISYLDEKRVVNDYRMQNLAKSIQRYGLLSPVIVKPRENGQYELLAGKRRLLACKMLGWEKIPAFIKEDVSEGEEIIISLIENLQRADLAPIKVAEFLNEIKEKVAKEERVAEVLNISKKLVNKYLALLNLDEKFKRELESQIFLTVIDSLAFLAQRFPQPEDQKKIWEYIIGFNPWLQIKVIEECDDDLENLKSICDMKIANSFKVEACGDLEVCPFIPELLRDLIIELIKLAKVKRRFDLSLAAWLKEMESKKE